MKTFIVTGFNPSTSHNYDLGVFTARNEQDAIRQARVVKHWHELVGLELSAVKVRVQQEEPNHDTH